MTKNKLTPKSENVSKWYNEVVLKAELADYGPAKGTIVFREYGYAIWEKVQKIFNKWMKAYGVKNAYFPLLIPYSLLEKEKKHVKGFSPELAIVTHGGGKKLEDPLVIRPTSETVMYHMYSKWIESWRDLPVLINQWNNVVRWEMRTYLFLRTTEFLWQEGHTAHESEEKAIDMQEAALEWYRKLYEEYFAMPVLTGIKSESETFAGAKSTYTIEILMPDGKALQGATSHNLGQAFAKTFDINFQDKKGKNRYVWQTSWGLSTRSLGGLFLVHGDDKGLILPPKVAPIKAVIIPILGKKDKKILNYCNKIKKKLDEDDDRFGVVEVWDGKDKKFGWKVNEAELKGIPIVLEVGPKEFENKTVTLNYRLETMGKETVGIKKLEKTFYKKLEDIQEALFDDANEHLKDNTHKVSNYKDFKKLMKNNKGLIWAHWCENEECERKIKEETKATTRLKSLDAKKEEGECVYCKKNASNKWLFAQAY